MHTHYPVPKNVKASGEVDEKAQEKTSKIDTMMFLFSTSDISS